MYNYNDLNSFIQKQIGKTKDGSEQLFTLFFNNSVFRAVILLHNSVEVDLLTELSRTCLNSRRKFWIKQRTFPKMFRTSPEESTGFTSIAILSQEKFKTWEVMCCYLCQLPRFRSVTPFQRNQVDLHGIQSTNTQFKRLEFTSLMEEILC